MRQYTKTQRNKPYPEPQSERESLQNMLWGIGVSIPGSNVTDPHSPFYVEMSELRDMVQWQMEKAAKEPEFRKGHMGEQGLEGFRDYLKWRDRRQMGALQFTVPGIPGVGGGSR